MKNIFRKSTYFSVFVLVLFVIISCEEEFTDIGTGVVSNAEFSTGEFVLELEITQNNIASVRADNIDLGLLGEYWLGVYNKPYAKKIAASLVSQLSLASDLLISESVVDEATTVYNLDKVILKMPYTAVLKGVESDGKPKYKLDSILGDASIPTKLEVFRNGTFINRLDPSDPSKGNSFSSDFVYEEKELLTAAAGFTFMPSPNDTVFYFNRVDRSLDVNSTTMIQDSLKLSNSGSLSAPFLAIPLDLVEMKRLFWDKFEDSEFLSSLEFQNYFRGIIVKATGTDGSLVPFDLAPVVPHSIDFFYSKTVSKNSVVTENTTATYSFNLSNGANSLYNMMPASVPVPNGNFVIQGTAGSSATVKILGVNLAALKVDTPLDAILEYEDKDANKDGFLDLEELASIKDNSINEPGLLVNNASLTFNVDQTKNSEVDILPQNLLIYKNIENSGKITPTHIEDSYTEPSYYGGLINEDEEKKSVSYNFIITDYISSALNGSIDNFSTLELKVFNSITDSPVSPGGVFDGKVKTYNWNPRSVVLLNGDKAQLKISYSKKKK